MFTLCEAPVTQTYFLIIAGFIQRTSSLSLRFYIASAEKDYLHEYITRCDPTGHVRKLRVSGLKCSFSDMSYTLNIDAD